MRAASSSRTRARRSSARVVERRNELSFDALGLKLTHEGQTKSARVVERRNELFLDAQGVEAREGQTKAAAVKERRNELFCDAQGLEVREGQTKSARLVERRNELFCDAQGLEVREGQAKSARMVERRNELFCDAQGLEVREGQTKSAAVQMERAKKREFKEAIKRVEQVRVRSELARKHLQLTPHGLTAQGEYENLFNFKKIPESVINSTRQRDLTEALERRSVRYTARPRLSSGDLKARLIAYQKDHFDVVIKHGKNHEIKNAARVLQKLEGKKGEDEDVRDAKRTRR